MTRPWTPEALAAVRELQTNCRDFIYQCCEFLAQDAPEVTTEHVNTVLAWIASTQVEETKETDQ